MMKTKKGFTLIEMLVVIAIIAVLVSIIIPTVTAATDKAAAATNAANLRAVKAEATTNYLLTGTVETYTRVVAEAVEGMVAAGEPVWVENGPGDDDDIEVRFGNYTIQDFADFANGDEVPEGGSGSSVKPAGHVHDYDFHDTKHWCTDEECDAHTPADHSYTDDKCVCGKTKPVVTHTCTYEDEWKDGKWKHRCTDQNCPNGNRGWKECTISSQNQNGKHYCSVCKGEHNHKSWDCSYC